jgi:hypothetical protein
MRGSNTPTNNCNGYVPSVTGIVSPEWCPLGVVSSVPHPLSRIPVHQVPSYAFDSAELGSTATARTMTMKLNRRSVLIDDPIATLPILVREVPCMVSEQIRRAQDSSDERVAAPFEQLCPLLRVRPEDRVKDAQRHGVYGQR